MLYNVRYGTGTGPGFNFPVPFMGYLRRTTNNLERIIDFIRSQSPDIIGLVEVDIGSFRTRRENQAEVIAEALGHFHCYQSKYAAWSFAQFIPVLNKQVNAFLSSDVIRNEKFHYFDRGIKRLVIELELEDLTVFLVHLSIKFRHRQEQLRELYEMVKNVKKPLIVAGDFNPIWGDREMDLFLAATGLKNANAGGVPSYPSRAPRRQMDFILHNSQIEVTRFEIPEVVLSDHLPLICDFEIRPAAGDEAPRPVS